MWVADWWSVPRHEAVPGVQTESSPDMVVSPAEDDEELMGLTRRVHVEIWVDPWFEGLDLPAKMLFFYLWTSPNCSPVGVLTVTAARIAFDTGIDRSMVPNLLRSLAPKVLWFEDEDRVLVRAFIARQGGDKGKYRIKVLSELRELLDTGSVVCAELVKVYPEMCAEAGYPINEERQPEDTVSPQRDTLPEPLDTESQSNDTISQTSDSVSPSPDTLSIPYRYQDQDQDQDQDQRSPPKVPPKGDVASDKQTKSTKPRERNSETKSKPGGVVRKRVEERFEEVNGFKPTPDKGAWISLSKKAESSGLTSEQLIAVVDAFFDDHTAAEKGHPIAWFAKGWDSYRAKACRHEVKTKLDDGSGWAGNVVRMDDPSSCPF